MKLLVSLCLFSYWHCLSYGQSELKNPFDFNRLKDLFKLKIPENTTQSPQTAKQSEYASDTNSQYDRPADYSQYPSESEYPEYGSEPQFPQYGSEPQYSQYGSESEYPQYNSESQYPQYASRSQYPTEPDYPLNSANSQSPQYRSVSQKNQIATKLPLRTDNIADVYLICQFIVLIAAERYKVAGRRRRSTPLYRLSTQIKVQKLDENIFFWNKNTGRIIVIVEHKLMKEYKDEISTLRVQRKIDLNLVFEELLGINFKKVSCQSQAIFEKLSKIFAKILGIDTSPAGLFNLYGLQLFKRDLQISVVQRSTLFSGIGSLYEISEVHLLAQKICETSMLINLAAPWNSNSILGDRINPIATRSGYTILNLLGNRNLIRSIDSAIAELIDDLESEELNELAAYLISKNALDFPILR